MRGGALVLAGLVLATATSAVAAPEASGSGPGARRPDISLPLEGVVSNPDWIEKPNGDDFATYFPRVAEMLGLSGHTAMRCEVSTSGTLVNCSITQEQPPGLGFGDAALKISQFFRMKPMSVDGVPVAGGRINIPIQFAVPQPAEPPPAPADEPQPSPRVLELARRVAATDYGPAQIQLYVGRLRQSIAAQLSGASLTEQEQAAIDDFVQASIDSAPQRVEALARLYAHDFSEAQLTEIAAFLGSPTGLAWTTRSAGSGPEAAADEARIERSLMVEARSRFCIKYDCLKIDVGPAPAAVKK